MAAGQARDCAVASDANRPHAVTATWCVWGALSRMFKHRLSLKSMTYPIAVRSTSVSGSIARVSSSASYQNLSIAHSSSGEAIELPEGSPEQECIDRLD